MTDLARLGDPDLVRERRGYVDVGDMSQIHYRAWRGGGDQTLVCLHQIPSDSSHFSALASYLLARRWDVIALDMPGFGNSTPVKPAEINTIVSSVAEALSTLLPDTRFHLLGHHTGALVSAVLATSSCQVVSLICIGLPYFVDKKTRDARASANIPAKIEPRGDGQHLVAEWKRMQALSPTSAPSIVADEIKCALMANDYGWAYKAVYSFDTSTIMALELPTLIVAPTEDRLFPFQRNANQELATSEYVELDGAGVFVIRESPEVIAGILEDWIHKLEHAHVR